MKLITAIIRPERVPEVKAALFRAGVTGITLTRVSGHGGEHEVIQRYRANTVVVEFAESDSPSNIKPPRSVCFSPSA